MPLQDSYNTGDNVGHPIGATTWRCQTFTAGAAYDIESVKLLMYRNGIPRTVTVSIRETDGGEPDGGDLCVGTIDGDDLTTDTAGEWKEITFGSPASLTSGFTYAIVIRAVDAVSTNKAYWRVDNTPSYGDGSVGSSSDDGPWTMQETYDAMFETYGVAAWPAGTIAGVSGESGALAFETTGMVAGIAGVSGESGVLAFETTGMIASIAGVSGGSGVLTSIGVLIGTIAAVAVLSADILFVEIIKPSTSVTIKRLVVAGNDQIWYEDA